MKEITIAPTLTTSRPNVLIIGKRVFKEEKVRKIKVVELFAGAGGLALGLENAGLKTIFLNEIDKIK